MVLSDDAGVWPLEPIAGWRSVGLVRHDAQAREAMASRLQAMRGWQLAFACGSAREVLAELEHNAPSVLLVDLGLPGGDALEILRQAGRCWPACVAMAICDDAAAMHSLRLPEVQTGRPVCNGAPGNRDLARPPPAAWPPAMAR
jgi:hypothetical protein